MSPWAFELCSVLCVGMSCGLLTVVVQVAAHYLRCGLDALVTT